MALLVGDDYKNTLDASIYGLSNDLLLGYDGNDTLYCGDGDDMAEGGKGDDEVYGQEGDDRLKGQEDNDCLSGGAGKDTLEGDIGNDRLYGDEGDDRLFGGNGNDFLDGGSGIDQLYGGNGDDYLSGYDYDDVYGGVAVVDYLYGGSNNDDYLVDALDVVVEYATGGIDKVYSIGNYTLGENVENLSVGSRGSIGRGNSLDNSIQGGEDGTYFFYGELGNDTLTGYDRNDTLDGGAGNDKLYGKDGDDYLNGRSGDDYMAGDTGNDRYVVDSALDVVEEDGNEVGEENEFGIVDTVISSVSYRLGAYVENLTLDGSAVKGIGNDLSNYMLGNAGNNAIYAQSGNDTVNGRGGDDTIVGGSGNDNLVGDAGADKFRFEFQSEGIDVIRDFNSSEGDKIQIVQWSFGATSLSQFSYNSTTGALLFASPTGASVQLATIANKPAGFSVQNDIVLV
jgi:Ca2+-binding RTX toxin-like protein